MKKLLCGLGVLLVLVGCSINNKITIDGDILSSSIWDNLNNTTWSYDNGWAGETYVFYSDNNGNKKCINQVHGSGVPIVSRKYIHISLNDDDTIKLGDEIFSFQNNELISENKKLTLSENKPLVFNHMCGPIDMEIVKSDDFDIENIDVDCEEKNNISDDEIVEQYGMDIKIVKFLEGQDQISWINEDDGKSFCSYTILDQEEDVLYFYTLCEEFYIQDKEFICPNYDSQEKCFMTKTLNKSECYDLCEVKNVDSYLAQGGGSAVPVKLTKNDDTYSIWMPRDGSNYKKDLDENFTKEASETLSKIGGGGLRDIIIKRAENHFGIKAKFEDKTELDKNCHSFSDCELPMEYAIKSNCPYTVKCEDNKCFVGCYDFKDYTEFPRLKNYSWNDVNDILNSGNVKEVFQSHNLDIELHLKNGTIVYVQEPEIDAIFDLINSCGEVCKNIIKGTE
ncbi:MAG: hypothetical protein PHI37_04645 [Candidatus Gracilibacteria bacterium]|nr:hypothetical protein [Candidatus Gracilibacteria bacterium]